MSDADQRVYLASGLLFAVTPTDRALAGWGIGRHGQDIIDSVARCGSDQRTIIERALRDADV